MRRALSSTSSTAPQGKKRSGLWCFHRLVIPAECSKASVTRPYHHINLKKDLKYVQVSRVSRSLKLPTLLLARHTAQHKYSYDHTRTIAFSSIHGSSDLFPTVLHIFSHSPSTLCEGLILDQRTGCSCCATLEQPSWKRCALAWAIYCNLHKLLINKYTCTENWYQTSEVAGSYLPGLQRRKYWVRCERSYNASRD